MNRFARTAGRHFGHVSSTIAQASRHVIPPNLSSWKLALYVVVFLLPGGSFAILGMAWFENRQNRQKRSATPRAAKPHAAARKLALPPCVTPCTPHGKL